MTRYKHVVLLISAIVLFGCRFVETRVCLVLPTAYLPDTFSESDLIGKWEINHGSIAVDSGSRITDTLVINPDGAFQQLYYEPTPPEYRFEVQGEGWYLDRLPDGRVRLILPGGRYFQAGTKFSENNGKRSGMLFGFIDPFSDDIVYMEDNLTLTVVQTRSGEYLLYQMWTSPDGGFPILGCSGGFFEHYDDIDD